MLEPDLTVFQVVGPKDIRERRVRHTWLHPDADMAVSILHDWTSRNEVGMRNRVLTLSRRRPDTGEAIATFAFPFTTVEAMEPNEGEVSQYGTYVAIQDEFQSESFEDVIQRVRIRASEHRGNVTSYHEEGLGLTRGQTYRTTIDLTGGTSGGPVFDHSGMVFAINSAGVAGQSDSTASSIENLLEMELSEVRMDQNRILRNATVEEVITAAGGRIGE